MRNFEGYCRAAAVFTLAAVLAQGAWAAPVTFSVSLISDELEVRAVPKHALEVVSGDAVAATASTGVDGTAVVELPAGSYAVRSAQPVPFQGATYSWNVPFTVGGAAVRIELSTDNATQGASAGGASAADIFQKVERGVVTVESETGHGTGFLVDPAGLILTNDHVIGGSRFFVAQFDKETRYRAVVVAADVAADLAIIAVHPDVVAGLPVIPLAADTMEAPATLVGEAVFAIGSPLSQSKIITSGIVSKNESEAIISDVSINPGNSGGPMLNSKGEAVAVNTFRDPSPGGSGVAGSVRIWKAVQLLSDARAQIPAPEVLVQEKLPSYPDTAYPVEALRDIVMAKQFDLQDYQQTTKLFDILLLTPPALTYYRHETEIEASKGRGKRRDKDKVAGEDVFDPLGDLRAWNRYVGGLKPVVRVEFSPRVKAKVGSVIGAALLGTSAVLRYEYRADFDRVQLFNNGELMQPISVGRAQAAAIYMRSEAGRMQDAAYGGWAEYLPEAFNPNGGEVYFEVYDEDDPEKPRKEKVSPDLLERIRQDFTVVTAP